MGYSGVQWGQCAQWAAHLESRAWVNFCTKKLNIKFLVHFVCKLKIKFNLPECAGNPPHSPRSPRHGSHCKSISGTVKMAPRPFELIAAA